MENENWVVWCHGKEEVASNTMRNGKMRTIFEILLEVVVILVA